MSGSEAAAAIGGGAAVDRGAALFAAVFGDAGIASNVLAHLEMATDARQLRLASRLCAEAVAGHAWEQARNARLPRRYAVTPGSDLARWRRCFPRARFVRLVAASPYMVLTDADAVALAGVEHVYVRVAPVDLGGGEEAVASVSPAALAAGLARVQSLSVYCWLGANFPALCQAVAGAVDVRIADCAGASDDSLGRLVGVRALDVALCVVNGAPPPQLHGSFLAGMRHLATLRLKGHADGGSGGLPPLASLARVAASLRQLALDGLRGGADDEVPDLPLLERLEIVGAGGGGGGGLTGAALARMPRLREAVFTGLPLLADDGLRTAPASLRSLLLRRCPAVGGACFVHLCGLTYLGWGLVDGTAPAASPLALARALGDAARECPDLGQLEVTNLRRSVGEGARQALQTQLRAEQRGPAAAAAQVTLRPDGHAVVGAQLVAFCAMSWKRGAAMVAGATAAS